MKYLLDSHCHLDFLRDADEQKELVDQLADQGIALVAQTVLPSEFPDLARRLSEWEAAGLRTVRPSLGFHPWWMEDSDQAAAELAIFESQLGVTPYLGEIGLDFSPRPLEAASRDLQIETFRELLTMVCRAAARRPEMSPYILSIHTVRSASVVLDLLEEVGAKESMLIPILHRFNGTSQELTRHLRLGGYLSVHPMMLRTKKGRAYVQQVPRDRLLLETDLPAEPVVVGGSEQVGAVADDIRQSLEGTVETLSVLRQESMREVVVVNQQRLYGEW